MNGYTPSSVATGQQSLNKATIPSTVDFSSFTMMFSSILDYVGKRHTKPNLRSSKILFSQRRPDVLYFERKDFHRSTLSLNK